MHVLRILTPGAKTKPLTNDSQVKPTAGETADQEIAERARSGARSRSQPDREIEAVGRGAHSRTRRGGW
eukprot:8974692-Alexandrium_andersonii.AAC.1